MNKPILVLLGVLALSACGSPPAEPESLWDSLPSPSVSEDAPKELPAKIWEEETEEAGAPPEAAESALPREDLSGKLVLNEIYYDAVGADTDGVVFVELYGVPGLAIGSAKVNFVDGGDGSIDDAVTLPEDARVAADGFYVVADARTGASNATNVSGADLIDNFDPQNGPDAVQLLDREGRLLDAIAYGPATVPTAENGLAIFETHPSTDPAGGRSLERKEAGADTDDNAADFVERESPTPGS